MVAAPADAVDDHRPAAEDMPHLFGQGDQPRIGPVLPAMFAAALVEAEVFAVHFSHFHLSLKQKRDRPVSGQSRFL